jgi:glucokinase
VAGVATALAIDIGGTKVAAGVVSREGVVLARDERPTPGSDDAEEVFAVVADLAGAVLAAGGVPAEAGGPIACGAGCGGPMRAGGASVSPLNIPAWRGFPLGPRLAEATGLPTFVENDAKALALAEGWRGAAAGERDFVAMVVSTGVGGGVVVEGRLLDGAHANAGHIGHVVVEPDGAPCACGARGCLEAEVSGPSIARRTGRPPADAPPEEVARAGRLVGRAVGSVCNLLDLPLAVVAGSVALGFGEPFFAAAQDELDRVCRLDFSRGALIRPAGLGASGPLVGAAGVAWQGLGVRLWA